MAVKLEDAHYCTLYDHNIEMKWKKNDSYFVSFITDDELRRIHVIWGNENTNNTL